MSEIGAKTVDTVHKQICVDISQKCVNRYQTEKNDFLHQIVTMDETLVRFYESKNKVECEVWKHPDSAAKFHEFADLMDNKC